MSIASPPVLRANVDTVRTFTRSLVRAAGFWTAVTLPFVILAVLASGVAQQQPLAFAGLLAANLLALVVGQNHHR